MKGKNDLIRVVSGSQGIKADLGNCGEGRGAYVCKDIECIRKASKRKGFDRSFRKAAPSALYSELEKVITKDGQENGVIS
jgi:hypothetical protein